TCGDAPSQGAFCLYHEADPSHASGAPSRATERGEPLTPRGWRRTRCACTTTAHFWTSHTWPTRSTPWPPHHATDRCDAPHSVETALCASPRPLGIIGGLLLRVGSVA